MLSIKLISDNSISLLYSPLDKFHGRYQQNKEDINRTKKKYSKRLSLSFRPQLSAKGLAMGISVLKLKEENPSPNTRIIYSQNETLHKTTNSHKQKITSFLVPQNF